MSLPYVNSPQKTVLNSAKTWEPKRLLSRLSNMCDGTFLSIELFSYSKKSEIKYGVPPLPIHPDQG